MVAAVLAFLFIGAEPDGSVELARADDAELAFESVEEVAVIAFPASFPESIVNVPHWNAADSEETLNVEEWVVRPDGGVDHWFEWIRMGEQGSLDENRGIAVLRDGVSEIRPVVGVILRPVREANLLLPERLDPFSDGEEAIVGKPNDSFSFKRQRELLGDGLSLGADIPAGKDAVWHYQIQAGGSFRQGNSSNTNVRGGVLIERRSGRGRIMGRVDGTYDHNGDSTGFNNRNRRIFSEAIIDRNLRGRWLCYAQEQVQYDEAAMVLLRSVTSGGLGFRFVDNLRQRVIVRSGPTVSQVIYSQLTHNDAEFKSGWLVESEYRQLIAEATRIQWTTSAFPDFDSEQQFRVRSDAAMLFPIGGVKSHWNWKLGLIHEYQLNPVTGAKPSDITGNFSILYAN